MFGSHADPFNSVLLNATLIVLKNNGYGVMDVPGTHSNPFKIVLIK